MAKINKPKSSPAIDMTPMVDLAFLLVTFFMLSANFRTDELVTVEVADSISDTVIPETTLTITVDEGGRYYFGIKGKNEPKKTVLEALGKKYDVKFTPEQVEKFYELSDVGCSVQELPSFLDKSSDERKELLAKNIVNGVPGDSLNNQLRDWFLIAKQKMTDFGRDEYVVAQEKGSIMKADDFKAKYVIRADGQSAYKRVKQFVDGVREYETKFFFVTSLKADPRKAE